MKKVLTSLLVGFSLLAGSVFAKGPDEVIRDTGDAVLKLLDENRDLVGTNSAEILEKVEAIVFKSLDFEKMSILAIGKNWRKATKAQQVAFIEEFRKLMIRTYSKSLEEYVDVEIKYLPYNPDSNPKKATISTEVIRKVGPKIPVDYRLYQNKEGDWKVYDIKIEGISLVTNYRNSFGQQIRDKGMESLLNLLRKQNSEVTNTETNKAS